MRADVVALHTPGGVAHTTCADLCRPVQTDLFHTQTCTTNLVAFHTPRLHTPWHTQVVCADVRAIDINMGCPVKFSVQGGMGAALLSKPERVKDILGTLVRNLPGVPVTCKIRLLDSAHDTLQLARAIQETGVAALAVHGRRRNDRPRWWAQWDQVALLRQQLGPELPLLPNGDIFLPEHVRGAREATGCDSLMLARGAMWNASLFCAPEAELRPQREVVARYVALCRRYDSYLGSGLRLGVRVS